MDDKQEMKMEELYVPMPDNTKRWGMAGALITALAASICCGGPLVLLLLGVSGAWTGNLTALEPYRPLFIGATMGLLGFSFFRVYHKPREVCSPTSQCANPGSRRINKILLWMAAGLAVVLLALPYFAPRLASGSFGKTAGSDRELDANKETETVSLRVDGMSCTGCAATVTAVLAALEGVTDAKVTLDPPRAVVIYDPDKISPGDMTRATAEAGYPSLIEQPEGG